MTGFEIAIATAAVSAVGTMATASAQAGAARKNAALLDEQARRERDQGEANAQDHRRGQSAVQARARALRAGSGVVTSTGSPLMVDEATAAEIALGEARIRNNADLEAQTLQQQAAIKRSEARSTMTAGVLNAGGTLLSGFSQMPKSPKLPRIGYTAGIRGPGGRLVGGV